MNYNLHDIIFGAMLGGVIVVYTVVYVVCCIYARRYDLEPEQSRRFREYEQLRKYREQEQLHRCQEHGTGDKGRTGRGGR